MHLASIIHLTDLHLFVNADGSTRGARAKRFNFRLRNRALREPVVDERHVITRALAQVSDGVGHASDASWVTLQHSLREVVRDESAPVTVVQTGDVEAFGSGWDEVTDFPGYAALRRLATTLGSIKPINWFDVYGNHDVWFGRPPLPGMSAAEHTAQCLTRIGALPGLEPSWPVLSDPLPTASPAVTLQICRINTVTTRHLPAFLAHGRVLRHIPPAHPTDADTAACVHDVRQFPARDPGQIRLAMMHHPLHLFADGLIDSIKQRLTTGALAGREELTRALDVIGVTLVAAGHRHALDPAIGAEPGGAQPPLPRTMLQLVADTPTVSEQTPSFAVYRIFGEDASDQYRVTRHLYRHSGGVRDVYIPEAQPSLDRCLLL